MSYAPSPRKSRSALTSLALAMLLASVGTSAANVALPTLERVFAAPFGAVQWVVLAYLLSTTVTIVNAGRLADIFGPRPMILVGLSLFTGASLLCGVSPNLWTLIVARALQGVGAAILMTIAVAIIRDTVAQDRIGRAMGLLGTMSAIGTAAGPSLGGLLIAAIGWRSIFLAMALLGAVAFLLAERSLPRSPEPRAPDENRFDMASAGVLGVSLASYALAMTLHGKSTHWYTALLLLAAGVGVVLFFRLQARRSPALIPVETLRDAGLLGNLAATALVATVMMATLVVGPFYLSRALGLDVAAVGLVMAVGPVISTLTGVPAGRFTDRFGPRAMVLMGLILMAAGAGALTTLPEIMGVPGYLVAIVVLTPGYQLFQAANNTLIMRDAAPERKGVISGMLGLARNLGLVTGASAMGAVFSFAASTDDLARAQPSAAATGMQVTFATAAGLILIALWTVARQRLPAADQSMDAEYDDGRG